MNSLVLLDVETLKLETLPAQYALALISICSNLVMRVLTSTRYNEAGEVMCILVIGLDA